jgi:hypothetical protein
VVGEIDVTGIDRGEFVDHGCILIGRTGKAERRSALK